jgi:hypothetical protein
MKDLVGRGYDPGMNELVAITALTSTLLLAELGTNCIAAELASREARRRVERVELLRNQGVFDRLLPSWLPMRAGQFVLIADGGLIDFFASYDEAYCAGLDTVGLDAPFFVSEVSVPRPVVVL